MATITGEFEQLQSDLQEGGADGVLDRLVDLLRQKKQYRDLFSALEMQIRRRHGLPLLRSEDGDDLDPEIRDAYEQELFTACREVGTLLLKDGQIRDGWMYMRYVGDNKAVEEILNNLEVDEDNVEDIVEVALGEGVAPALGYGLVLEHYGTCNAITTYESQIIHQAKSTQQEAAGLLVRHLHEELLATVKADIAHQEGTEPPETTLKELVAERDWLFLDNNYHVDTTHLASTTRFSRILDNEHELRLALDLTEYGRRLGSQFQFQENEPFADMYPSHALYFQALLRENVDEAVGYFRDKAETVDREEHGTIAVEVYIDLLARLGKYQEAVDATLQMIPDGAQYGIAPSLFELSGKASDFQSYMEYCEQKEDLLGYATGLVCSRANLE